MTDNLQYDAEEMADKSIAKLERAMGGLNITLGTVLGIDGIILAVIAFCCLLMSFSLFFMAAIPAFLVIGFLCLMAFCGAIANIVTGVGAVLAAKKQTKVLRFVPIVAIAVDIAVIPANVIALVCGAYLLYTEVNWLSVLIFIVAACAIMLAVVSLVLSIIRMFKRKKSDNK
ncbi:MAG: hypothetical protein K2K13_05140 [Clostridiales bacterium]|nr:hypothetical protein [Clostridiales bacterium]